MPELLCPRCETKFELGSVSCDTCGLPLYPLKLAEYSANIEMQINRLGDADDVLFHDKYIRVVPENYAEGADETIVYHKGHRFKLLDFLTIRRGARPIIYAKIRAEKGLILYYPTKHPYSDLFLEFLAYLGESLGWIIKDVSEAFNHHSEIEDKLEKAGVK